MQSGWAGEGKSSPTVDGGRRINFVGEKEQEQKNIFIPTLVLENW